MWWMIKLVALVGRLFERALEDARLVLIPHPARVVLIQPHARFYNNPAKATQDRMGNQGSWRKWGSVQKCQDRTCKCLPPGATCPPTSVRFHMIWIQSQLVCVGESTTGCMAARLTPANGVARTASSVLLSCLRRAAPHRRHLPSHLLPPRFSHLHTPECSAGSCLVRPCSQLLAAIALLYKHPPSFASSLFSYSLHQHLNLFIKATNLQQQLPTPPTPTPTRSTFPRTQYIPTSWLFSLRISLTSSMRLSTCSTPRSARN